MGVADDVAKRLGIKQWLRMDKEGMWDRNSSLGLREVAHSGDTVPESTAAAARKRGDRESLSCSPRGGTEFTLPSVQFKFYRSVSAPTMMLSTPSLNYKHQEKGRIGGRLYVPVPKPKYRESPKPKSQKSSKRDPAVKQLQSEDSSLPQISPSMKVGGMDRLPLEIRCEYCGQLTAKKTYACHTKWCLRQRELRSNSKSASSSIRGQESRSKSKPELPARDAGSHNGIVARVVTVGLFPGQCEQVFIHSRSDEPKRPQTRTLPHSSLQNSGYGLPSLDRVVKGQSDSQAPQHMVQCKTCSKVIASDRVGVHHHLCKSPQLSTGVVQIPSTHNLLRVGNKQSMQTPVHSRAPCKPPTVACYICGREYGSKSLPIHEPQCLKKFNIQNDKLPIKERLPLPRKSRASAVARVLLREEEQIATPSLPEGVYRNVMPDEGLMQQFFEHCYSEFEKELIPCKKCGRTFAPERHVKHEPNCNAKPL